MTALSSATRTRPSIFPPKAFSSKKAKDILSACIRNTRYSENSDNISTAFRHNAVFFLVKVGAMNKMDFMNKMKMKKSNYHFLSDRTFCDNPLLCYTITIYLCTSTLFMIKKMRSTARELFHAIGAIAKEEGELWTAFFVGALDPRYKRTFFGGGVYAVHRRLGLEKTWQRNAALRSFEKQKLLHVRRSGKKILLSLTEKGKRALLKEQMCSAPLCQNKESIVVVFDIPEKMREIRHQLRLLLKECEFFQLQRSVWVSRRDVLLFLQQFIRSLECEAWIRVFRTRDIE